MPTTISEATELTGEDSRLVHKWGGPKYLKGDLRGVVLVGRLQRTLVARAKALADQGGLVVVDGRAGPATRRALDAYNAAHPEDAIELGPELAPLVAAVVVPDAEPTADSLEDPPDSDDPGDHGACVTSESGGGDTRRRRHHHHHEHDLPESRSGEAPGGDEQGE